MALKQLHPIKILVLFPIPLDADTCAALRGLLRKCASLRAGKSELDDEVIMMNILATISVRLKAEASQFNQNMSI